MPRRVEPQQRTAAPEHLGGRDRDALFEDRTARAAVLHELTVIGEAASRITPGLRARHPEMPWSDRGVSQRGERWGREVEISRAAMARIDRSVPLRTRGCRAVRELTVERPLAEWSALGVTLPSGERLPTSTLEASLVRGSKRYFLVYRNYQALLDYNCSNSYAASVGALADRIGR